MKPTLAVLIVALSLAACGAEEGEELLQVGLARIQQESGTDVLLRTVRAVTGDVAWAAGRDGTWALTTDGGVDWRSGVVPGAEDLEFRAVDAVDARSAWLLGAPPDGASRVYHTDDAGETWTLQLGDGGPEASLACMAFWDPRRGVAFGVAAEGGPRVLRTEDGGETWTPVPAGSLPPAGEGESGVAPGGACVATARGGRAWIATGNGPEARVLRSGDWGATWTATPVPVEGGAGAGATSVGILGGDLGFAMGGRLEAGSGGGRTVAVTRDGGATWSAGGPLGVPGAVHGASAVPGLPGPTLLAVGPWGARWSPDFGTTWRHADTLAYRAVDFASREAGWAVGPEGRISRFLFVER